MSGDGFDADATRIDPTTGQPDEGRDDHALRAAAHAFTGRDRMGQLRGRMYPWAVAGGVAAASLRAPALMAPFLTPLLTQAIGDVQIVRHRHRLDEIIDRAGARGDVAMAADAALLLATSYSGRVTDRSVAAQARAVAWGAAAQHDYFALVANLLELSELPEAAVSALIECAEGEWLLSPQARANLAGTVILALGGRAWEAPHVRLMVVQALEELALLIQVDTSTGGFGLISWPDPNLSGTIAESFHRRVQRNLAEAPLEPVFATIECHVAQAVADAHALKGYKRVTSLLNGWTDGERVDIHRLARGVSLGLTNEGDENRAAAWSQIGELPRADAIATATRLTGGVARGGVVPPGPGDIGR